MSPFDRLQRQDIKNETRIFRSEVAIMLVAAILVVAYLMLA